MTWWHRAGGRCLVAAATVAAYGLMLLAGVLR